MPRGSGISLAGKRYNIVQDHETYVVADVPAHPDSDSRMERRVHYDSWIKGILKRRASSSPQDQSIVSTNIYNRIERPGDGLWITYGADTRMGDRIFGQRLVGASPAPASKPLSFGDSSIYSFITCLQHVYSISGVSAGTQQIVLSKDFTAISPTVNITDSISYKGRIYFAVAQLTNGMPDPAKPQPMWVWDQTSTTTNWTNPPTALPAPTWIDGVSTTTAGPVAISGAATIAIGTTVGMPGAGNFNIVIDNEVLSVNKLNATTVNVVTRGVLGSPAQAHQKGAAVVYNPSISVGGSAGQARW